MQIRQATLADIAAIMALLDNGRKRMEAIGNATQWRKGYPSQATVEEDLRLGQCFVGEEAGRVVATFVLAPGPDNTYAHIWQGQWIDDERPYHVVHRMAASETQRGVFAQAIDFCKARVDNLRIDTHRDNAPMLHNIRKHGFEYCGIIHAYDGSDRLAFQWLRTKTY